MAFSCVVCSCFFKYSFISAALTCPSPSASASLCMAAALSFAAPASSPAFACIATAAAKAFSRTLYSSSNLPAAVITSLAAAVTVPLMLYFASISPALALAIIRLLSAISLPLRIPSLIVAPAAARLVTQLGMGPTPSFSTKVLLKTQQLRRRRSYSKPGQSSFISSMISSISLSVFEVLPMSSDSLYTCALQPLGGHWKTPVRSGA
mmetsp:Transcript_32376/g.60951  ORF Transcript_32376/g.60951 Transcript_32376/m.60951 type:complete len:207 (-) Transcript_32376:226-846(-)